MLRKTSNIMADVARGDPQLGRFYNNMTPNAAISLITQNGPTHPARRDKSAFTEQGPVAKRLPPQMPIAGNDCLKRSIETISSIFCALRAQIIQICLLGKILDLVDLTATRLEYGDPTGRFKS